MQDQITSRYDTTTLILHRNNTWLQKVKTMTDSLFK